MKRYFLVRQSLLQNSAFPLTQISASPSIHQNSQNEVSRSHLSYLCTYTSHHCSFLPDHIFLPRPQYGQRRQLPLRRLLLLILLHLFRLPRQWRCSWRQNVSSSSQYSHTRHTGHKCKWQLDRSISSRRAVRTWELLRAECGGTSRVGGKERFSAGGGELR